MKYEVYAQVKIVVDAESEEEAEEKADMEMTIAVDTDLIAINEIRQVQP